MVDINIKGTARPLSMNVRVVNRGEQTHIMIYKIALYCFLLDALKC
jgi:hypothetical protein